MSEHIVLLDDEGLAPSTRLKRPDCEHTWQQFAYTCPEQMLDHLQAVDERLEGMCGALTKMGSDYCAKELPALPEDDFTEAAQAAQRDTQSH